ncbi:helitron_like_N domain-containing protein [Trichonephila clavipes]|uniref:Helitron_like_N domain-containing protein n=1 Tax=Trichonephila clavipes TaxID=2585209 RepID=A0A8X6T8P4_TRICX|nr:helitron_like_N domain-containing protein [Trichonephila clavipes]
MQNHRALTQASFNRLAFEYDPEIDNLSHALIIGNMDKECQHCHAFKYKGESACLCCASGKVSLPPLNPPPEPLKTLLAGATSQSKLFLHKIRKFNSCFQMTSFGAAKIVHNEDGHNFESTFKIQGQVYHQIGSVLSMPDADPKFLQIYFMCDEEQQANTCSIYNHIQQMDE